ncbi:MAG TPA: DNA/RNA helicase domain-containing protein, partial [Verrucomicrobiae bacterium]|nr:DNA/RNA helicase domain-containing protein [Verrucomicrobiae bacterium]
GQGWIYRSLAGARWGFLRNEIDRQYLVNSYRVLLTRARRGLVIWVPQGDSSDHTRLPEYFDSTADYLGRCGIQVI